MLEYFVVIGALVNIILTAYYAGLWMINAIACNDNYYPLLWVTLNIPVNIGSVLALSFQAKTSSVEGVQREISRFPVGRLSARWIRIEFAPCAQQPATHLEMREESLIFVLWWWFGSLGTVAYVMYGTVTFSSLMLIGELLKS